MDGFGAPETWQVKEATAPSVTLMLTGGALNAGVIPAQSINTGVAKQAATLLKSVCLMQLTYTYKHVRMYKSLQED